MTHNPQIDNLVFQEFPQKYFSYSTTGMIRSIYWHDSWFSEHHVFMQPLSRLRE